MNWLKKCTKRLLMSVLFLGALFSTFQGISGVEAQSLSTYIGIGGEAQHDEVNSSYIDHKLKAIGVALKFLPRASTVATQISSSKEVEAAPPTLEEAYDWSQYPSTTVMATGYTAGYESTGKGPSHPEFGITYSGVKVKRDLYSTVAADLNVFPIGTILFIPGYGYGVVADKGGAIKGNRLDLYYETVKDVYEQWGKKEVKVYIVQKGNGKLSEKELTAWNENKAMQVFRQQYIGSERK